MESGMPRRSRKILSGDISSLAGVLVVGGFWEYWWSVDFHDNKGHGQHGPDSVDFRHKETLRSDAIYESPAQNRGHLLIFLMDKESAHICPRD